MAVLESRQVVVWSIPTLAALLFSLVWLRRRRHNGRPDPSSGDTICDPGGTVFTSSTPALLRSPPIHIPISPIIDEIGSQSFIDEGNHTGVDPFHAEEVPEAIAPPSQEVIIEAEKPEPTANVPELEFSYEREPPFDGNKTIELFLENYTLSCEVEDSGLGPAEFTSSFDQEQVEGTVAEEVVCREQDSSIVESETKIPAEIEIFETQIEDCDTAPDQTSLLTDHQEEESMQPVGAEETDPAEIEQETVSPNSETFEPEPEEKSPEATPIVNSIPDKPLPESTILQEEPTNPLVADMEKVMLEEKLASLELDTMKMSEERGKDNAERDSANQSPSEVMLASPSISNFSDAHSEGSSDSGKGHSDVATSPSRTPAGGSSVAGDAAFSVYEFVLPQVMVGRLIGRHGCFIQELRINTHTHIFIKRHPDTSKLKICAIEGTQQDIDKALEKIRQKFPLRRFPKLTLEKVSFLSLNTLPPLNPENFHLQLVEGVNNDVLLSSLISAAQFFLQQPSHPTYTALSRLNQVMNVVYSNAEAPALETPIKDAICAAPTMGGWYRAQIVAVDEDNQKCDVRFLDYGGYLSLEASLLRQIRGDLLMLPFQAVECYLANVIPVGEEGWSEEARLVVQSLTHGRLLQAQIYDYAEDGVPLVYLYSTEGAQIVLINEELVSRGYATLAPPAEE